MSEKYQIVKRETYSGNNLYAIQIKKKFLFWIYWSDYIVVYSPEFAIELLEELEFAANLPDRKRLSEHKKHD